MYVFEYACVRGSERVLSVTGTVVDLDRVVGWNGGSQFRPRQYSGQRVRSGTDGMD